MTGGYVAPEAGRRTFRDHAEAWKAVQVHRQSTVLHVETMLRLHAYPTFGDRALSSVRPSEIQAWVRGISDTLAPATVEVAYRYVAAIFRAAVADRVIASSPCTGVNLPRKARHEVVPLATELVEALIEAIRTGTGRSSSSRPGRVSVRVRRSGSSGGTWTSASIVEGRAAACPTPRRGTRREPTEDRRQPPDDPTPPGRRRRAGGASGDVSGRRRVPVHHGYRRADPPYRVLGEGLAAGGQESRPARGDRIPRTQALLRIAADPARGVGQGRTAQVGPCDGRGNPRHLLASVAGLRGSDAAGSRFRARCSFCCAPRVPRGRQRRVS